MSGKVIFLYKSFPEKIQELLETDQAGIYALPETVLVGIEVGRFNQWERQKIASTFSLREFEVEQSKFSQIVKSIPYLKARLLNVEISKSHHSPDLEEELNEAIMTQDFDKVVSIIDEFSDLGHDVESIEYLLNRERVRYTRMAELDINSLGSDSNDSNVYSLLRTAPVGFLSGIVREDELR